MASIVLVSDISGSVTITVPEVSGSALLNLPTVSGSIIGADESGNINHTGNITVSGDVTAFSTSDNLFKENIQDIPNALEIVNAIGGKTFDWSDAYITEKGGVDGYFVNKTDFGVIAQDVQAAFPLAVRTRPDGKLVVDYVKLCALAFAAIKELKAEVEQIKSVWTTITLKDYGFLSKW